MVKFSNAHIIIDKKIVADVFGDSAKVSWVYYPKKDIMMIANASDEFFKSIHKTSNSILKHKNEKGDRSISIEELIIDNEVNDAERNLNFTVDNTIKILNISLK
jgi:hypothetical protein